MENKNNVALFSLVFLVVGIFVGWLIWGPNTRANFGGNNMMSSGMHQMPNGEMMENMGEMSMQEMMNSMNLQLQDKIGDSFDKAFLSEMIIHHQGAVVMAELALENAKHQEIKDLAKAIISAQNKEIGDMKRWQDAWYSR